MTSQTESYLVLCVEERDEFDYDSVVNRLFIAHDYETNTYVVYGKVTVQNDHTYEPFFFRATRSIDMYQFVKFVVGKDIPASYTLYNYNNVPYDVEKVDYAFMEQNMDKNYELATYDMVSLDKKRFRKTMRMLKNVYNFY
jgi:hypothetical protein